MNKQAPFTKVNTKVRQAPFTKYTACRKVIRLMKKIMSKTCIPTVINGSWDREKELTEWLAKCSSQLTLEFCQLGSSFSVPVPSRTQLLLFAKVYFHLAHYGSNQD